MSAEVVNELVGDSAISFAIALSESIGPETIHWTPITYVSKFELTSLNTFVSRMESNGMRFHPSSGLASSATITLFRSQAWLEVSRPLRFTEDVKLGSHLVAEGAPFAVDSPALFLGYKSVGTVSGAHTVANTKLILSDLRYMEGMEGSAITNTDGVSIGILAGSLRKTNGEGELSVIVPWSTILKTMSAYQSSQIFNLLNRSSLTSNGAIGIAGTPNVTPPTQVHKQTDDFYKSVVCITVRRQGGFKTSWGSGVVLSQNIVVTNRHVVPKDFKSANVTFPESSVRRQISAVFQPVSGLDIVYLVLDSAYSDARPATLSTNLANCSQLKPVTTVGYGLFPLSTNDLKQYSIPLVSNGYISQAVSLPLLQKDKHASTALLSVSAYCWNGSSGGAVFTNPTDGTKRVLAGIIVSNGRVDKTDTIYPQLGFAIPINIISLGLEAMASRQQMHLHERVKRLWKLQPTHTEVLDVLTSIKSNL
ncbi:trypsin-like cysteine/serine peptidase domain-containing protein [Lipomyces arxii]|uniref:trypsin-like cysteine/serine peptidase domain-containing protein n=1 Tax=Lipomyces arxii TaxID=56418 RepID=UPI0034CDC009